MTERLNYAQMHEACRALYVGRRHYIEQAEKGEVKRPPEWFVEQRRALENIAAIGAELRLIAGNAAAYDAWKATLAKGRAA